MKEILFNEIMKKFGYSIVERVRISHGDFRWDEYYTTYEYHIIQTKLFRSEEERDKSRTEYERKHYNEIEVDEKLIILPFEFDETNYE